MNDDRGHDKSDRKIRCLSDGEGSPIEKFERDFLTENPGIRWRERTGPKQCAWKQSRCQHVQTCARFNENTHTRYSFPSNATFKSPFKSASMIGRVPIKTGTAPDWSYTLFYESSDALNSYDKSIGAYMGGCPANLPKADVIKTTGYCKDASSVKDVRAFIEAHTLGFDTEGNKFNTYSTCADTNNHDNCTDIPTTIENFNYNLGAEQLETGKNCGYVASYRQETLMKNMKCQEPDKMKKECQQFCSIWRGGSAGESVYGFSVGQKPTTTKPSKRLPQLWSDKKEDLKTYFGPAPGSRMNFGLTIANKIFS